MLATQPGCRMARLSPKRPFLTVLVVATQKGVTDGHFADQWLFAQNHLGTSDREKKKKPSQKFGGEKQPYAKLPFPLPFRAR